MPKVLKAPQFDNLDDVTSKFKNTVVYYGGKAMLVKGCGYQQKADGQVILDKFTLALAPYRGGPKDIKIDDPEFNYKDYNIGYVNHSQAAVWWFRKPLKQYQQGLKRDQLSYISSDPYLMLDDHFNFSRPYIAMLENEYPMMAACEKLLKDHETKSAAFHKHFALSWDEIHEDFVLEYRGKKIGVSINGNLGEFKLVAEFKHLAEALQEAIA